MYLSVVKNKVCVCVCVCGRGCAPELSRSHSRPQNTLVQDGISRVLTPEAEGVCEEVLQLHTARSENKGTESILKTIVL